MNLKHDEIVNNYLIENKQKEMLYMLTIARDGEDPVRSIYHFDNSIEAVEAYNRYTDWGFAKNYLTVCLYEGNKIHKKILKRPPAGECTFLKEDYIKITEILLSIKEYIEDEIYNKMIKEFGLLFSKDNIRFNYERFCENTKAKVMVE